MGCLVRLLLTAAQAGDAPQAMPLIDALEANVVIADAAYDSDTLRGEISAKHAKAVIPNDLSRARKYPLDKAL